MSNHYVSGGAAPTIIGIAGLVTGSISVLTALGDNAVIKTGAGNGFDMTASILVAGIGYGVLKGKSSLAAWLFFGLSASLIVYGNYTVDTERAVGVVGAAASAATAAASSAAVAATSSANGSYYQYAPQQTTPKEQYRHLTSAELSKCNTGAKWTKSEAGQRNCSTKMCPVATCGGG